MSTNNQRAAKAALFVSLVLLAVNAARIGAGQVTAQGPVTALASGAAPVPYTVVLAESILSKTGQRSVGPNQTWAVRSDGAYVFQIIEGGVTTRHITFPDGTRIDVNDTVHAKSTVRKPLERHWLKDPQQNCVSPPHRGIPIPQTAPTIETVQGHRAARISKYATTTWYALDAGCATLQRDIVYEQGGSSRLQLVSLIPGEPSAALFTTAADYREGTPSAFLQPPGPCGPACLESRKKHFERLDEQYRQYSLR
jgi:hypothetical protein